MLANKKPRQMFVQCHTSVKDGHVLLQDFDASANGLVDSFTSRFPAVDLALESLFEL